MDSRQMQLAIFLVVCTFCLKLSTELSGQVGTMIALPVLEEFLMYASISVVSCLRGGTEQVSLRTS